MHDLTSEISALTTVTFLNYIVLIAAAIVASRKIWSTVVKPVADISNMLPTIKAIAAEFRPNGGKSLKDVVNRIENDVARIKADVRSLEGVVSAVEEEVFPVENNTAIVETLAAALEEVLHGNADAVTETLTRQTETVTTKKDAR